MSEARKPGAKQLSPYLPRTKLPNYTPLLKAYLTSGSSFLKGKAPPPASLDMPHDMPARGHLDSREAKILGPLSKRREANIRWRYLTKYRSRLAAPISKEESESIYTLATITKPLPDNAYPCPLVSEDKMLERARRGDWERPKRITARFMRRRYHELLDKSVIISNRRNADGKEIYSVKKPDLAQEKARKFATTSEDQSWIPELLDSSMTER